MENNTPNAESRSGSQLQTKTAIVVAIILILLGGGYYFFYGSSNRQPWSYDLYKKVLEENAEFSIGDSLYRSNEFDQALEHFQAALVDARSTEEKIQIEYKIAQSTIESGKPVEGIQILKSLVASEDTPPKLRAYSVQMMGQALYSYNTKEVTDAVFTGAPYDSFVVNGDYSLARRKLFEYAGVFYKLGIPELRVAKWYSEEILKLEAGEKTESSEKEIADMKLIIRERLTNADSYLEAIATDDIAYSYTPEVIFRKAAVIGDLYISGDTSFGDPEEIYKKALEVTTIRTGLAASTKYSYASYLARKYGQTRSEDIKNLLADFKEGGPYKDTNLVRMLKATKDNNTVGSRDQILLLAKLDSDFKKFLISLGWQF